MSNFDENARELANALHKLDPPQPTLRDEVTRIIGEACGEASMSEPLPFSCCPHCGCTDDRIGHDDTCRFGCNDEVWVDSPDDADYQAPYEWKAKLPATYDSKTGAAYISFNPNPVSKTVTSDKAIVNLDYDANGNLVGIEVLL